MKKTYLIPAMQVEEAEAAQMIAESLKIANSTLDGSEALTKEYSGWNIWDQDDED